MKKALEYAIEKYAHYDFKSLTDISHQHPAWKKAREQDKYNPRMDYILYTVIICAFEKTC